MKSPVVRWAMPAFALIASLIVGGCRRTPDQHLQRAREASYDKDPQLALREYRLALDGVERDSSSAGQAIRASALRGAADIYYLDMHKIPQAAELYRELLQACPESPESLEGHIHLAALLRYHYRDLRGAISELSAAIARNAPQSPSLTYTVAKMYFELGDYAQAVLEANNVVGKYVTSRFAPDAMLLKAQALAMMEGKQTEAATAFRALVDRFPDSELQPHALFELGRLYAEQGQGEQAIDLWVEALKRHPDPKLVQSAIARARQHIHAAAPARIGDHLMAFDRAIRLKPKISSPPHSYWEVAEPPPGASRESSD